MMNWKVPAGIAALGIVGVGGYFGWETYGQPDVKACEAFIKEGLRSPSSYSRVSVIKGVEPISIEELQKLRPPSSFDKLLKGDRSLHLVSIEYDADNAYGTSIRGVEVCAFEMRNGELPDSTMIDLKARQSASKRTLRQLSEAGMIEGAPPGSTNSPARFPCCLN